MRCTSFRLFALLFFVTGGVQAQSGSGDAAGWNAYPAFGEVQAIDASSDRIWAGANGGVFSYAPATGEIERYTALDGLRGGELKAITFDTRRNTVWAGYSDGAIDAINAETGEIRTLLDITRADRFAARGVRRFRVEGDSLYAATDFGVVVINPTSGAVINTYSRLGTLGAGVGANDVVHARLADGTRGIWVATDEGLVSAPLASPALQAPSAWTVDATFGTTAFSLADFGATLYAAGGPAGALDVYRLLADGSWQRELFSNEPVLALKPVEDVLLGQTSFGVWIVRPGAARRQYRNGALGDIRGIAIGPGGSPWIGALLNGIIKLPPDTGADIVPFAIDSVIPDAPFTNQVLDMAISRDGVLWSVSRGIGSGQTAAISRLKDGAWTNWTTSDPANNFGTRAFRSASVGPDGTLYAGSGGDGLIVVSPDGAAQRFDASNSTLQSAGSTTNFVVVSEVAFEDDLRWVVAQQASQPLNLLKPDGTWTAFSFPSGLASPDGPMRIAIDRFDQKWLALGRNSGLMVWDTGDDPAIAADDRGRLYRGESAQGGSGLPNGDVNDVIVDLQGRVWLGTSRGIAYIFSPGSAFGNDPGLAVPQWPIVTEGENPDWLLRDVTISDLELDPAGQIWVASTSGAYLINTAGNGVVRHLTKENSLLPTNDIIGIAVDGTTGDVYLNTSLGLYVAQGDARRPTVGAEELAVAPNPFRPAQGDSGVLISGLRDGQSEVRILTLSGDAVYSGSVSGGAFRWDGRNGRTGELVPSGVYVVAASGQQGGGTTYGKVAVIR